MIVLLMLNILVTNNQPPNCFHIGNAMSFHPAPPLAGLPEVPLLGGSNMEQTPCGESILPSNPFLIVHERLHLAIDRPWLFSRNYLRWRANIVVLGQPIRSTPGGWSFDGRTFRRWRLHLQKQPETYIGVHPHQGWGCYLWMQED